MLTVNGMDFMISSFGARLDPSLICDDRITTDGGATGHSIAHTSPHDYFTGIVFYRQVKQHSDERHSAPQNTTTAKRRA